MLTASQQQFLAMAAAAAVACERDTKLPAAFTLAQAIFESGWGSSMPGNNCFGIKPDHHGSGIQYCLSAEFVNGTWEKKPEAFEKYATLADCFIDHARLLTLGDPYIAAWAQYLQDQDLAGFVGRVGAVYGTDPKYREKIWEEMHSQSVIEAIASARKALSDVG